MGSGGGEFLLSLKHPYQLTSVTEGWRPNYELLLKRLGPIGVQVEWVSADNHLNFPNEKFQRVLNRHESFDPLEVARVLQTEGIFITQQVGTGNNWPLTKRFYQTYSSVYTEINLSEQVNKLQAAGFAILFAEAAQLPLRFYDVGAIVYYAKIISWEFPDFSVKKYFEQLWKIQKIINKQGYFDSLEERFIIVAKKSKVTNALHTGETQKRKIV